MSYYFSKIVNDSFDETVEKVSVTLKEEGFGLLNEIDVKERLKERYNVTFRRYKILGACTPLFACMALTAGKECGTLLPCNVIVQEISDGQVKVTAIDPLASVQAFENPGLKKFAVEIGDKLKTVIGRV